MLMRVLSLVLLLAIGPSLLSTAAPCCARDTDCCSETGALPIAPDDCCSIACSSVHFAVNAPSVPQIAPATTPALLVPDLLAGVAAVAADPAVTSPPPRGPRFDILRN